jgi:hypothetical protein
MKMTKAETQLLEEIRSALLNGRNDEESILAIFKDGEYFSHGGNIRHIVEAEWLDWEDNCEGWTIWTEIIDE